MNEKHEKVCMTLNYVEHFLVFISVVSSCVSVSALPSEVSVPVCIVTSAVRLEICAIIGGTKKYK